MNRYVFGLLIVATAFCFSSSLSITVFADEPGRATALSDGLNEAPKTISWSDLAPENGKPFSDPFAKLTRNQLDDLSYVMRVRRLVADEKISVGDRDAKEASELADKLQKQGVDIAWLMVQRDRVRQLRGLQVEQLAKSISDSMRNRQVSLAGYVVPCKVDDEGRMLEFFLVPKAASCSHADPPPRLLVVFVATNPAITAPDKHTPVRLTGKLVAETTTRATVNGNGRVEVHAAYRMFSPDIQSWRQTVPSNETQRHNR